MKGNLYNRVLLTVVSVFAVIFFLNAGSNKHWLDTLVLPNWEKMRILYSESYERRQLARWGKPFLVATRLKNYFDNKNIKDPVLLFEPNEYYQQNNIEFKAPEPITFYYFTGYRGLWMSSEDIREATHLVLVTNDNLRIREITSEEQLEKIIERYKPYKATL